jgi:hypothetical protein
MVVVTRSMKNKAKILNVNTEMIYKNSESLKNIYKNRIYYKYNYNGVFYGLKFEDLEKISYNKYIENYKIDEDNTKSNRITDYHIKVANICQQYVKFIQKYQYRRHDRIEKLSNVYGILIWLISEENIKYTINKLSIFFKIAYNKIDTFIQDIENFNDLYYTREHPIYKLFNIYMNLYEKIICKIDKIQTWYKFISNRNKILSRVTFIKTISNKNINNDIIEYILNF